MGFRQKLAREIKEVALATLYFALWIGALVMIKQLILADYQIEFHGLSKALVGALILAKVVLILEHVSLGSWVRSRPALVNVLLRTVLYALGVFLVIILEKSFEGRSEHGGFVLSLLAVFQGADGYHIMVNTIVVSGALLGYNLLFVVRRQLGKGGLARLLLSPPPQGAEDEENAK